MTSGAEQYEECFTAALMLRLQTNREIGWNLMETFSGREKHFDTATRHFPKDGSSPLQRK